MFWNHHGRKDGILPAAPSDLEFGEYTRFFARWLECLRPFSEGSLVSADWAHRPLRKFNFFTFLSGLSKKEILSSLLLGKSVYILCFRKSNATMVRTLGDTYRVRCICAAVFSNFS